MSLLRHHQLLMNSSQSQSGTWDETVAALPALWAWWKLDEPAGAAWAIDSSGNGRNGEYTAAGTSGAGLYGGSAASRLTLGSRIDLQSYTISGGVFKFSMFAFINHPAALGIRSILSADGGLRAWQWRLNEAGFAEFLTIANPADPHFQSGLTNLKDGQPHMVAVVYDTSLALGTGRVKHYVDGLEDTASYSAQSFVMPTGNASPGIGGRNGSDNRELWGGAMDEVVIVNDALSAAQIANLWAVRNL